MGGSEVWALHLPQRTQKLESCSKRAEAYSVLIAVCFETSVVNNNSYQALTSAFGGQITSTIKVGKMEAQKLSQGELTGLDVEPGIASDERSLILLGGRPKKKIDETISTPQQYVSRYHYETKDLDSFMELCPHCRKPSVLALRKTVIDPAIEYLKEKEAIRERRANRRRIVWLTASLIGIAGGLYYVFFHLISGFRI